MTLRGCAVWPIIVIILTAVGIGDLALSCWPQTSNKPAQEILLFSVEPKGEIVANITRKDGGNPLQVSFPVAIKDRHAAVQIYVEVRLTSQPDFPVVSLKLSGNEEKIVSANANLIRALKEGRGKADVLLILAAFKPKSIDNQMENVIQEWIREKITGGASAGSAEYYWLETSDKAEGALAIPVTIVLEPPPLKVEYEFPAGTSPGFSLRITTPSSWVGVGCKMGKDPLYDREEDYGVIVGFPDFLWQGNPSEPVSANLNGIPLGTSVHPLCQVRDGLGREETVGIWATATATGIVPLNRDLKPFLRQVVDPPQTPWAGKLIPVYGKPISDTQK